MNQFFEIKLDKQTITMPLKFSYEQWLRLKKYGDKELTKSELISACSGFEEKTIKKADLETIEDIANVLSTFYFQTPQDDKIILTFEHNGIEYGLQKDFSKLAYGAWVDLEVYSSKDIDKNLNKILAVLYYPIKKWKGDKYILESYDEDMVSQTAEEFKTIPMEVWWGAASFFLLFVSRYIQDTQSSLTTKMKVNLMYRRGKKILPKWIQKKLPEDFTSIPFKF